jgi:hypothetical protein
MKIYVLGFIAIMAASCFGRVCRRYDCGNMTGLCAKVDNSLVTLNPCDINSTCEFSYEVSGDFSCVAKVPFYLPGEYCGSNCSWCISQTSTDKVCTGKKATEVCVSDVECDAGLYCFEKKCNATRSVANACDIAKGIKCDASAMCWNGICTLLGSLPVDTANKIPALCISYHANTTHCIKGPKLMEDTCATGDVCRHQYEDTGKNLSITCVCGKQNSTAAICPKALGDVVISDVMLDSLIF